MTVIAAFAVLGGIAVIPFAAKRVRRWVALAVVAGLAALILSGLEPVVLAWAADVAENGSDVATLAALPVRQGVVALTILAQAAAGAGSVFVLTGALPHAILRHKRERKHPASPAAEAVAPH